MFSAIDRMVRPAAMPLDMSSLSDKVRASLERLRIGGRIPPVGANILKIDEDGLSNNRPIEVRDSPFSQRLHISAFCSGVYFIRVL